jgi:hypothetical protein
MEIEYTFSDPKAFTKPFSATVKFNLQADTELFDTHCENEKDAIHLMSPRLGRIREDSRGRQRTKRAG